MKIADQQPISKLLSVIIGVIFVINLISVAIVYNKSDKYQGYFNSPEAAYALDKLQLHGYSEDSYDFLLTIQRMESYCLKYALKQIDREELDNFRRQAIGHLGVYQGETPIAISSRKLKTFSPAIDTAISFLQAVKDYENNKSNLDEVLEKASNALDAWSTFKIATYEREDKVKDTLRAADQLSIKLNGELVLWCYIVVFLNVIILLLSIYFIWKQVQEYVSRRKNIELMISSLSHDLRSPLHIISIAMHEFESDVSLQKHRRAFNLIRSSTRSLERLVDDIFKTTRGEDLQINLSSVDIQSWFDNLERVYSAKAADREITFHVESIFSFRFAEIDPDRLGQCIGNVIDNAIKYTTPGTGAITVQFEASTIDAGKNLGSLDFVISDNGRGISKKDSSLIYSPFIRGEGVDDVRGLGLGLSIFKRLADGFHAKYHFESEIGQGTTFTIKVPVAFISKMELTQEGVDEEHGLLTTIPKTHRPAEILVVDDEESILKMTASILREIGFEVDSVSTSEKAIERLREHDYEVVLTDVNMSGLSGIDLAKIIKSKPGKKPYVIGMSANRFNNGKEPRVAIFDQLLEKPFDEVVLVNAIGRYEQLNRLAE